MSLQTVLVQAAAMDKEGPSLPAILQACLDQAPVDSDTRAYVARLGGCADCGEPLAACQCKGGAH